MESRVFRKWKEAGYHRKAVGTGCISLTNHLPEYHGNVVDIRKYGGRTHNKRQHKLLKLLPEAATSGRADAQTIRQFVFKILYTQYVTYIIYIPPGWNHP